MIIREADIRAHNPKLLDKSASNSPCLQAFATTALALWLHDVALLQRLSLVSPTVRAHVQCDSREASLLDPTISFKKQVSEARRESLARVSASLLRYPFLIGYHSQSQLLRPPRPNHANCATLVGFR